MAVFQLLPARLPSLAGQPGWRFIRLIQPLNYSDTTVYNIVRAWV